MRVLFIALLAVTIVGCQTMNEQVAGCNLSGYTFCVKLPEGLQFTDESKGPDFVIFSSNDFEHGYGVYFYEGDYSSQGEDVEVIESRGKKLLGEVEYKVDIISAPDFDYSILLSRTDAQFPNSVRIFTNKKAGENEVLDEVLSGVKGCAKFEFAVSKCKI